MHEVLKDLSEKVCLLNSQFSGDHLRSGKSGQLSDETVGSVRLRFDSGQRICSEGKIFIAFL